MKNIFRNKHTPGPWRFVKEGDEWFIRMGSAIKRGSGLGIESHHEIELQPIDEDCPGQRKEAIANARLICAAPDLLEAAQILLLHEGDPDAVIDSSGRVLSQGEVLAKLRVAVKKARGGRK